MVCVCSCSLKLNMIECDVVDGETDERGRHEFKRRFSVTPGKRFTPWHYPSLSLYLSTTSSLAFSTDTQRCLVLLVLFWCFLLFALIIVLVELYCGVCERACACLCLCVCVSKYSKKKKKYNSSNKWHTNDVARRGGERSTKHNSKVCKNASKQQTVEEEEEEKEEK